MATRIFDRDTLLDLVVNAVPLFIMIFFLVGFLVVSPWEFHLLTTGLHIGLIVAPIVFLTILTYISAKAIAGDEKRHEVYLPGQATVTGATPLHHEQEAVPADEVESEDDEKPERKSIDSGEE